MRFFIGLALLALLGVLAVTNPGMPSFAAFVERQSERILQRETGDTPLGRMLAGAGSHLAGAYVERVTRRQNYLLFSVYTVDLAGTPADGTYDWRFLGLGRTFIELDNPDEKS